MGIEIIPSTALHAFELSKTLREKDKREAQGLGLEPRHGLFQAYRGACYRRTCLVDDEVAAMWGLHGNLLGTTGHPYLITGEKVYSVSQFTFARIYKQEVQIMRKMFPVLQNIVDADYPEAIRMLQLAGFSVSDEITEVTPDRWFRTFRMIS